MRTSLVPATMVALLWAASSEAVAAQQGERPRIDIRIEQADLSFDELQRLVPALERIELPEEFRVERLRASGPLTALTVDFLIRSRDSDMSGRVTGNLAGSPRTVSGSVTFSGMNLARLLGRPALPSHLTATSTFDLAISTGGGPPAITGDFSLEAQRIDVAGYQAQHVSASGRLDGQRLLVERARARAYGGSFTAEGRVGLPFGDRTLTYTLSGTAMDVNLARLPASIPGPRLDTSLNLSYRLSDQGGGLTGRARLDRSQLAGGIVADGTTATFDASGEKVRYSAAGRLLDVDPARVGQALDIEALSSDRFAGRVDASFSVEGSGATLQPLSLSLTDSQLFGGRIPEMKATVTLLEDEVRFTAIGEFEALDASTIAGDTELDGTLTGMLDVAGTVMRSDDAFDWCDVTLNGDVQLSDGSFEGVAIDMLALSGEVTDLVVKLQRLEVEGPDMILDASGTLAFDGTTVSQLTYHLDTPRLGAFREFLGEAGGDVTVDGRIAGTRQLHIDGTLEGSAVTYGNVAATTVDAKYAVVLPPDDPASATADVQMNATFVRVAGRTLTETVIDATYADRRVGFDARVRENERRITSSGELFLQPGQQQLWLNAFRFEAPSVVWQMPAGRDARIDYTKDRLTVDGFHVETPDQQVIAVDGTIGPMPDDGVLQMRLEGLALSDIDMLAFGSQGISGKVDATADIRGPLERPHVDARFSIQEGSLRGFRYASLTGTVESTTGDFQFSARLQQTQDAWLTAEGRVPRSLLGGDSTAADANIDVTVESSPIALGFVSGLTDIVGDVQGTIQANVRVTGTPQRPAFDGEVAIRDGAFLVPALGTSFTGLDTTIVFEPDAMVVPEFRLLDENGESLRFAGRLPYEAAGEGVAITVDSQDFELVDNEAADIQVSTNLMITGTLVAPRFEGTVRVTDGEIRVDRILDLRLGSYYRAEPLEASNGSAESATQEQGGDESTGIMQDVPVALDITLELPALVISGQNLRGPSAVPIGLGDVNLTVEGMLQLDKAIGEALILTGDISTVRGTYEFQGRRFEILRDGRIQFPGLVEINPLLDVTAQRTISGVEAQVHIDGTLRQPELTLSSQPPLDQADVLSLIVFNQPANQLGAAEQVSLGQRAAALATGFVASKLAESLGGVLDLDVLRIEAGESSAQGLAPSVTVGEQVGERLFLRLRQQFGPSSTSHLALEYEFAEWLRLQTTVSDESSPTQSPFRRGEQTGLNWIFSFSY